MKVYVVHESDYDSHYIHGVFDSMERAKRCLQASSSYDSIIELELNADKFCTHKRTHTNYEVGSGAETFDVFCTDCGAKV